MTRRPTRIGALISGGGRTLVNIADEIDAGRLDAAIALVISSRADVAGVDRARDRGFDVRIADRRSYPGERERHDAINAWLIESDVDLVCACGYLRLLDLDPGFAGRAMNIHPALLPDFGGQGMFGDRVHRAVLESERVESGCTVHFIDDVYDHGPIILQRRCPVRPGDDVDALAARVFAEECRAYPEAIRLYTEGRLLLEGDRVVITRESPTTGVDRR